MITSFTGENAFLSNFHPSPVTFELLQFPTVENAYQAAKSLSEEVRITFIGKTPGQAKRAGAKLPLRNDWEEVKFGVMKNLLRKKFQDKTLADLLTGTGTQIIIEGNDWGDTIWGMVQKDGHWVGNNRLGVMLMDIRDELNGG